MVHMNTIVSTGNGNSERRFVETGSLDFSNFAGNNVLKFHQMVQAKEKAKRKKEITTPKESEVKAT